MFAFEHPVGGEGPEMGTYNGMSTVNEAINMDEYGME